VLIFDDMISTGGSIVGAVEVAREHGAREIYVSATHAVLCGPAPARLREAGIKQCVFTNSLPLTGEKQLPDMTVVSVAPLLGEAIRRIHRNESVSGLFG
jgi:ribose-phosphate pyrophosphokinase